jgi:hypothetical protein
MAGWRSGSQSAGGWSRSQAPSATITACAASCEWIAPEEDRHCRALSRMARQRGVRRIVSHRSDALLIEMALAALFLRPAGLPEEWLARKDHHKTAAHFRRFREAWEMREIQEELRREMEEADARRPAPAEPAPAAPRVVPPCPPADGEDLPAVRRRFEDDWVVVPADMYEASCPDFPAAEVVEKGEFLDFPQPYDAGDGPDPADAPRNWPLTLGLSRYAPGERPIFACAVTMHLI